MPFAFVVVVVSALSLFVSCSASLSLVFCLLIIPIHIYIFKNFIPFRFVVIRAATRTTTTMAINTEIEQCVHATLVPACRASAKRLKARAVNE